MSEIGQKCHSRHLLGLVGIEYWATNVSKNYLPAILCGIFSISAGVCSAEDSAVQGKGQIDAKSFRCITEMTHVRQFYVDNLLGNLDATLAVANSATGGTYPPGSLRSPSTANDKLNAAFEAAWPQLGWTAFRRSND
jgi:hypothetical protein